MSKSGKNRKTKKNNLQKINKKRLGILIVGILLLMLLGTFALHVQ